MTDNQLTLDFFKLNLLLQKRMSLNQIATYHQKNDVQVRKSFCDSFQKLFQKGIALQTTGKLSEVAFLAISVLRTFIMEGKYQLRLDLYDSSYFLSKVECNVYLDVDYIFKYISSDIEAWVADLKECGGKFNSIEVDQLKKDYIDEYKEVARTFISQNIPAVLGLKEYDMLQKTNDFKIIYGEYLDQTILLYDTAAVESGAEG